MRERRSRSCLGPIFLIVLGTICGLVAGVVLPESGRQWVAGRLPGWLARGSATNSTPTPAPVSPVPTPTALPSAATSPPAATPTPTESVASSSDNLVIPPKPRDIARLYNGIRVHTALERSPGQPASLEREIFDDYTLDLRLQVKVPIPMRNLTELTRRSPNVGALLPKLPSLLEKAEVSKFFDAVYQNKMDFLRQNLTRLDALLGRDLFYDTDTILELQDPDSKRRALLIQTDMDVDTDGSDPERWNEVDTTDPTFQPLTNYKWLKRVPTVVSPLVKVYQDRIDKLEAEAKAPNARRGIAASVQTLRDNLYGVEHYSSLIARNDPYVVLPSFMARGGAGEFGPQVGDYVVVVAGNRLYPAIFGDKGPNHLLGEASIRLAQAVDPRATATRSPVDDLKITYLVFPGTAELPFGPPDLGHIRQRCKELLSEVGGSKTELHEWTSLLPPPPTPTPSPAGPASPAISPATSSPTPVPPSTPATGKASVSPSPSLTPGPAKP